MTLIRLRKKPMTRDESIAHLDEHGFVILEGALSPEEATELRRRAADLIAEERPAGAELYLDGKSQRVWNLVNKGSIFEEMIQLPKVLEYHEHLLGEDCVLSSFTVNLIGPGSPAGNFHVDSPLGKFPTPYPQAAFCANTIYVLDDFTPENGATRVVPGSYKRGRMPEPNQENLDAIQLEARMGDIVILHGATWHASGANQTQRERMILLGFFTRSFMKPQQDHLKLLSPEVMERASPTLKRLLGCDSQPGSRT